MRIGGLPALLGAAIAMMAGCAGHRPAQPGQGCLASFQIDNRGPEAVEVYVHRGALIRLGTAPAWRTVHLVIPNGPAAGAEIRLVARVVGGGRPVQTDELRPFAGDRVRWTILQPLEHSAITAVVEPGGACAR